MRYHIPRDFYLFIFMYTSIFNRKQQQQQQQQHRAKRASQSEKERIPKRDAMVAQYKQMKITTITRDTNEIQHWRNSQHK